MFCFISFKGSLFDIFKNILYRFPVERTLNFLDVYCNFADFIIFNRFYKCLTTLELTNIIIQCWRI